MNHILFAYEYKVVQISKKIRNLHLQICKREIISDEIL